MNAEETKKWKAKQLRYKKPLVKDLNLMKIQEELMEIWEECENVSWLENEEYDILIDVFDGSEEDADEFKLLFSDLGAECERLYYDLKEEWIPECFDRFFVTVSIGEDFGGLLGYDAYEQDYFGIPCTDAWAEDEAKMTLMRMTKEHIIAAARQCFRVYHSFVGLRYRYDCLKSSLDILKNRNIGYLETIKKIDELYAKANEENFCEWSPATKQFDEMLKTLPSEVWVR